MGHNYKDKYVSIRDIYNSVKNKIMTPGKWIKSKNEHKQSSIKYTDFYNIIKRYVEILMRDVTLRGREVSLPNKMGYIYLTEKPHRRAFHVRVDNEATKREGKTVTKKVPILDDFYKKLVWVGPPKYKYCKILPLGFSKRIINKN